MSEHHITPGPGDVVYVHDPEGQSIGKPYRGKGYYKLRASGVPVATPSTGAPVTPVTVKGTPGLPWAVDVKGSDMTARQLLVAAGGGATFSYEPPAPPPPPDPDPDPEDPPPEPPPAESAEYEGYGSQATGGLTPYAWTNANDSGPGSLRYALDSTAGGLLIQPSFQGVVTLGSSITARGDDITIDGATAPGGGVTLRGAPILWTNRTNVIVRQLRFRDPYSGTVDGMTFKYSDRIIVDHVSFQGATDGQVDFTRECQNVTVQWCLIGPGVSGHNYLTLIGTGTKRVTVHHSLFYGGVTRQPQSQWNSDGHPGLPSETVLDARNNVIWSPSVGEYGISFNLASIGNAVRNYFNLWQTGSNRAIHTENGGSAYAAGNYSKNSGSLTGHTSRAETAVPSYAVVTMEATAELAAAAVIADVGCRVGGLASWDQAKIDAIEAAGL